MAEPEEEPTIRERPAMCGGEAALQTVEEDSAGSIGRGRKIRGLV